MVFPKWNQNVPWSKHGGCGLWSIHPMPSESPRDSWHSSTPERFPASPRYMARPPGRTAGKKKWLEPNGSNNWCGYGSIPINTTFSGMNIHFPAILMFTRYQGFDPSPCVCLVTLGMTLVNFGIFVLLQLRGCSVFGCWLLDLFRSHVIILYRVP